ncbi:unnamed protein product [Closterium sp. NIES-65]|nr:unnamed protein product [Closterium sp. NIES-65]
MAESTLLARSPAKYSSLSAFSPTRIPRSACSPSPRAALPSRIPITAFAATRHDSPPSPLLTRPRASPLGTSQRVTRLSRVPLLSPAPGQSHQTSNVSEYSRSAECKRRGAVVSRAFLLPVDPWSPNVDSQSIASSLFAVSLFPYLGFLYFLTRSGTAPRITLFGFYFLLAFVGATTVVDAAFAAAEAIATGVPVTGGVRALGAAADVADDLPSLVDTSARRDLGEEAWKKGTRREIPITEADFEREGIQEDEELLDKDEPMEALVNVMLGEEPGADGGGGEDVEEVERSPPLESGTSAESISASLASHARERGPNVIKGDPNTAVTKDGHVHFVPSDYVSDFNLKATHVLHNLSQAELYELAIKDEKGTYITSNGALATLSGAKTGRSPKDKRIVKEETSQDDLWWGKYVFLENVVFDSHTRVVDYADKSVTENTRAAYPIEYIPNAKIPCVGPHPRNVILLACDAFGVLPPVSKLTLPQTMYHFISGYTALVAGTEEGIKEPQATFSACFGAAFIMWHPIKYADHVDGVPQEILEPQNMWTDKGAYNATLTKLGGLFNSNFSKFTESMSGVDTTLAQQILSAGPQLA